MAEETQEYKDTLADLLGQPVENNETQEAQQEELMQEDYSEIFGEGIKTKEDLKKVAEELSSLKDLSEKFGQKEEYYLSKLKETQGTDLDETVFVLNELKKKTESDDVALLTRIANDNFEGLSDVDKVAMKMIYENPVLKGKESVVRDMIEEKFGITEFQDNEDWDDDERARAKADHDRKQEIAKAGLLVDAGQSVRFFKSLKEGIVKPEAVDFNAEFDKYTGDMSAKHEELSKSWTKVYDDYSSKTKSIPLEINGKDGNVKLMDFNIDESYYQTAKEEAIGIMASQGLDVNDENVGYMQDYINNRFKIDHFNDILNAAVGKARQMSQEEFDREYNNPSQLSNNQVAPQSEKSEYEKTIEELFKD